MGDIKEQITKETAILATEKGYIDRTITGWYSEYSPWWHSSYLTKEHYENKTGWFAPTQSKLQKWLREKHNIHIAVIPYKDINDKIFFEHEIYNEELNEQTFIREKHELYEDALEVALKEALKLLR